MRLSERLGASPRVSEALRHTYARWDGKVFSDLPNRSEQSALARLVHMVHVAQTYHHIGGIAAADATVRDRSGGEFDPEFARLWLQNSHDMLERLGRDSVWDDALATEPEPYLWVSPSHLDDGRRQRPPGRPGQAAAYGVKYIKYWLDEKERNVFCLVEARE